MLENARNKSNKIKALMHIKKLSIQVKLRLFFFQLSIIVASNAPKTKKHMEHIGIRAPIIAII
jgi:hypothetical protein